MEHEIKCIDKSMVLHVTFKGHNLYTVSEAKCIWLPVDSSGFQAVL